MKDKKTLKLVLATAMAIFNLFVCFVATYSWFCNAKNNDASDLAVIMEANELKINYSIYKYDNNLNEVVESDNFQMLPYDSIIKERNKTTPIVIKVTLFGNVLVNKSTSDVEILMNCTETSGSTNYLSNIVHFKFGVLNIDSTDVSDIYYQTLDGLSNATKYKFITTVKLTNVECLINAPVSDSTITLYSILNYDEDLIDARHIDVASDEFPSFENDINFVRYGVHE